MKVQLNRKNVEYIYRVREVEKKVSRGAAIKEVRKFAVEQQQLMGKNKGVIMDGRDIGTVVFPKAELKIFLTADNMVRVERRFKELYAKNPNITIDEVKANLEMRDYIDSNRKVDPLRQAEDAILLDNTNLTEEETVNKALHLVKKVSGK